MNQKIINSLLKAQRREITEYNVYLFLSRNTTSKNKEILKEIADQEKKHYEILKKITKKEVSPSKLKLFLYVLISKIFGLNFTLQLMEIGERYSKSFYSSLIKKDRSLETLKIIDEETKHEKKLISLIDEKRLSYIGSFVLGLNDALVELTGALAGLTLALNNAKIIAMVGLITGIAASMSMAVSNYLAAKEENNKNPLFSGYVTGLAYIFTVITLIFPFFFLSKPIFALGVSLVLAVLVIALFNFYTAVIKQRNFLSSFLKMAVISLSVALVNFGIGFLVKKIFGIDL
jgi:VIT1/CCC1 family predicted Fe2+/Mn2+ transporter